MPSISPGLIHQAIIILEQDALSVSGNIFWWMSSGTSLRSALHCSRCFGRKINIRRRVCGGMTGRPSIASAAAQLS